MQKKEERQSKQKSEEELPMEKLTAHWLCSYEKCIFMSI